MIWYIAFGSAVGGAGRYLLGTTLQRLAGTTFPVGTLVINILGSCVLGFLVRWAADSTAVTPEARALLTTGFCGGFTTFSTFSAETVALLEDGDWGRAALYVAASVGLALAGTMLGIAAARELGAWRRAV
ncbi:MAG TPA: fluoride efflux transporter CrcB [Gemmatimonadales bacterium]|nr:fluoride efflux transporter CrcB [Gemmatimonadales bacterium]